MPQIVLSILPFIFIDVNGVIDPVDKSDLDKSLYRTSNRISYSENSLEVLAKIVEETSGFLILTGSPILDRKQFEKYKLFIVDSTNPREDHIRGLEIKDWLQSYLNINHNIKTTDDIPYIILDTYMDDISPYHSDNHCVRVDQSQGLNLELSNIAINLISLQQQDINHRLNIRGDVYNGENYL